MELTTLSCTNRFVFIFLPNYVFTSYICIIKGNHLGLPCFGISSLHFCYELMAMHVMFSINDHGQVPRHLLALLLLVWKYLHGKSWLLIDYLSCIGNFIIFHFSLTVFAIFLIACPLLMSFARHNINACEVDSP